MDGNNQQTNNQQANNQTNTQAQQTNTQSANQQPEFDYEKLASIISGKQTVAEEQVLKGYFKQQGLSKEEMDQAIASFKQQQAANKPDVTALQNAASTANQKAAEAILENKATLAAVQLGIDAKTIPYVLKMADLSKAVGQDGSINEEEVKNILNKVLEDVPALKPQAQQTSGFKFGAAGGQATENSVDEELDRIFGVKKK